MKQHFFFFLVVLMKTLPIDSEMKEQAVPPPFPTNMVVKKVLTKSFPNLSF